MDGQTYREVVRRARTCIERGTAEDLAAAERNLETLRNIFPKQMEYICAVVALMIARGEDGERCRYILDYTAQEYYVSPTLADVFELKSRTFPEGTPEWRQACFARDFYKTGILPQEDFVRLHALRAAFLAEPSNVDLLRALAEAYYVTRNMLAYFVLMMAYCRQMDREDYDALLCEDTGIPYPDPILHGNYGFLLRLLTDGRRNTFLLLGRADDTSDQEVLAHALGILGQQTILVRETQTVECAEDVSACALHCIQEAHAVGEQIVLDVGVCRTADGKEESVTPAVIRLLARRTEQESPLIVFARDVRMDGLHKQEALAGDIQRLSYCLPPHFSYAFSFAWAGDYLTYINYFYGENVEPLLDAPASCDFSIVIPVRNSAETLRYTLETCLAIDYDGSYEIVISDNSDEGQDEVHRLVEELNDPRIRYYRPLFVLPLTKSFEYALLHARGAFIFSLGADDGVLPWALKYIKKAMVDYPNASIFSWRRGFYTWPGFMPEGRDVQIIHCFDAEQSEHYQIYPMQTNHAEIIPNIKPALYRIPLLYINSGFRRSYLREVLQRTGRMLDGMSQDVYMGAVNLFLQERNVELQCPITIAGMSGKSQGHASTRFVSHVEDVAPGRSRSSLHTRQGEYVPRASEMAVPYIAMADTFIFYMSLCRLADFGIPMTFQPEQTYRELSNHILLEDMRFERYWGLLLYGSTFRGDAVHENCREVYQKICDHPQYNDDPGEWVLSTEKKGYLAEACALTLDPTEFDCQNVSDAMRLTEHILHL